MHFKNLVQELNEQRIAAAPEDGQDGYAIDFAETDTSEEIAQVEAMLGVPVPAQLQALWREHGAFRHRCYMLAWRKSRSTRPDAASIHEPKILGG